MKNVVSVMDNVPTIKCPNCDGELRQVSKKLKNKWSCNDGCGYTEVR